MAKKKSLFSWSKFWKNMIVSAVIDEANKNKIVLTFKSVKPFTNVVKTEFTITNTPSRTVSSISIDHSAKTVTITASGDFIYGYVPTVTFDPARKGETITDQAITNQVLFDYIAPASLAATAASNTQINLTWTCASAREDGFSIEMSPINETAYTEIYTPAANATSYNKTGLTRNTKYYFKMRSKRGDYYSAYCTAANATTLDEG